MPMSKTLPTDWSPEQAAAVGQLAQGFVDPLAVQPVDAFEPERQVLDGPNAGTWGARLRLDQERLTWPLVVNALGRISS